MFNNREYKFHVFLQDHLRDFLVQIREFTGEDDTDLYLEEREVILEITCQHLRRPHFNLLLSDRPEGSAGGEEKSPDVGAWHPEPPRGG